MAERKTGPVKPPTIDLTAREAGAETDKPSRRSVPRRPVAEAAEPIEDIAPIEGAEPADEAIDGGEVTAADADGLPEPQPIPPAPPTPPEPPRRAAPAPSPAPATATAPLPWGMLGTAALAGALLGTALTYVLATVVPLPAPPVPNLAPELSTQADRITTLEDRLAAAEAGTLDARSAVDTASTDLAAKVAALESDLDGVRGSIPAPADTTALEERLRTLASRVDAIAAGASSADAGAIAENIGDLEQGLAALEAQVAALQTEAETAAAEPVAPAPSASLALIVAGLETAFATGQPFATELAGLAGEQPPVTIDPTLSARAGHGLQRPDVLDEHFVTAVPAMLEAKPAASGDWQQNATAWLSSLLAIRPAEEVEGDSPEAVMSRLEGAMSRHDYAAATALFAALPPEMVAAGQYVADEAALLAAAQALLADLHARVDPS